MKSVWKRELRSCFCTLHGYVFCAMLLLLTGVYVMSFNLRQHYSNFEYALSYVSFILIPLIPILTMRSFAEERRQRTDRLLYTLPLSMLQVVLGKFLALATVLMTACGVMAIFPLLLLPYGAVNLASAYGALIAFFFLALALIAMGVFVSAFFENQAFAAGVCFILLLLIYYCSDLSTYVTSSVAGSLAAAGVLWLLLAILVWSETRSISTAVIVFAALETVSALCAVLWRAEFGLLLVKGMDCLALFRMFYTFVDGLFDLRIILYYLAITAAVLLLTACKLEKRRWIE